MSKKPICGSNGLKMVKFSISTFLAKNITRLFLVSIFFASCATIQTPTGGPRDKTPPVVISQSPKNLTTNFEAKKIEIEFNEFIKLNNQAREISISPAFEKDPEIKIKKKTLEITFQDTLSKNTTYTINFGKAIADFNEGNILKNYSYVWSTGKVIDSLSLSGTVLGSMSKKPAPEITVLVVPANQDTLFTRRRANVFTLTDSAGNFRLKNLKEGIYRIYALKEQGGGDRIYNSSKEEIAFLKDSIVLRKDISGVNLTLFTEIPHDLRVLNKSVATDGRFSIIFNKSLDDPGLRLLNDAELDKKKYFEFNKTKDSLSLWVPVINYDSLAVEVSAKGTPVDTVVFNNLNQGKKYNYGVTLSSNTSNLLLRENTDLVLKSSTKIALLNSTKITLLEDSVAVDGAEISADPASARSLRVKFNWRKKKQYIVKADEGAITGISGGTNKLFTDAFIIDSEDNYAILQLKVTVPDSSAAYLVQLLRNESEVYSSKAITKSGDIIYTGLSPGRYGVRVIYDLNKNGKWDTGNLQERIQPEPIWNSMEVYTLRPALELDQPVTIPKSP